MRRRLCETRARNSHTRHPQRARRTSARPRVASRPQTEWGAKQHSHWSGLGVRVWCRERGGTGVCTVLNTRAGWPRAAVHCVYVGRTVARQPCAEASPTSSRLFLRLTARYTSEAVVTNCVRDVSMKGSEKQALPCYCGRSPPPLLDDNALARSLRFATLPATAPGNVANRSGANRSALRTGGNMARGGPPVINRTRSPSRKGSARRQPLSHSSV